ncbi:hypothetical protein ACFYSF_05020 [Streptomyces canus]|uniref:hypothetical protein n=1 Tax=Streptomyces canus TaxID=58343 RepID=UPI0036A840C9
MTELFKTHDPGRPSLDLSLVHVDREQGQVWEYCPQTDAFHWSPELSRDFFLERELEYTPIDAADAIQKARSGVGSIKSQTDSRELLRRIADPDKRPAVKILGESPNPPGRVHQGHQHAELVAHVARTTGGGVVFASLREEDAAHEVMKNVLRGDVHGLPQAEFDAWVQERGDHYDVLVQETPGAIAPTTVVHDLSELAEEELESISSVVGDESPDISVDEAEAALIKASLMVAAAHLDEVRMRYRQQTGHGLDIRERRAATIRDASH